MDTESIRLFVHAADRLNISAAGRHLDIAPAVASARLAKLEKQIGADLLHRSTRKVSLTQEGEEFLPFAREILAQEDAARAALGQGSTEVTGTLRFAASSTFAQLYVAPLLPEFTARYPGIKLELKFSDTQVNIIEGAFDLALRNVPIADSSLRARKLADDTRLLCAAPSYLKQWGTPQNPEDLADHQLLLLGDGPARKLSFKDGSLEGTFPPPRAERTIRFDDGMCMKIATIAGAGISMNALWSAHQELRNGSLIRVLPDFEIKDDSAVWLVYPKSNVLTAKVRVFIDFMLEKIGDEPVWER